MHRQIFFQTFQLQMLSPSGTVIAPADQVTQVLRITNPNKVCTALHRQNLGCLLLNCTVYSSVLKMEEVHSSETSLLFYQPTQHYILGDSTLYLYFHWCF
jgi:hypothetical protein